MSFYTDFDPAYTAIGLIANRPAIPTSRQQMYWSFDTAVLYGCSSDMQWVEIGGGVMTGATASLNGESGLVPQPLAGDEAKFLRGDASWQDVSTELEHAQTLSDPTVASGYNRLIMAPVEIDDTLTVAGSASVLNSSLDVLLPDSVRFKNRTQDAGAPASGSRKLYALDGDLMQIADGGNVGAMGIDHRRSYMYWADDARTVVGNPLVALVDTSQAYNMFAYQAAGSAMGDEYSWDVLLESGEYIFGSLYIKSTDTAIHTWQLNGAALASYDSYASLTYNSIFTRRVTIAAPAVYTVSVEAASRNVSATLWRIFLTCFWFTPVASLPVSVTNEQG